MNWWQRFLSDLKRRKTPPAPPPPLPVVAFGIGSHFDDAQEVVQIAGMAFPHARLTFYTQNTHPDYRRHFAERLMRFADAGIEVLITVHDFADWRAAGLVMAELDRLYPGHTWQVGNEEDAKGMTGFEYATYMREVVKNIPGERLVGAGVSYELGLFIEPYRRVSGPRLRAWAIHSYGLFLVDGLTERVRLARAALGPETELWVTEIGVNHRDMIAAWPAEATTWGQDTIDQAQSFELSQVLLKALELPIQRLYIYQLVDGGDTGYGVLRDDRVTERPAAIVIRSWMNMNRAWLRARAAGDLVE